MKKGKRSAAEEMLRAAAEQIRTGEEKKPETVTISPTSGIHVFETEDDIECIMAGDVKELIALLGCATEELIDKGIRAGNQRSKMEAMIIKTVQTAILVSRMTAFENAKKGSENDS